MYLGAVRHAGYVVTVKIAADKLVQQGYLAAEEATTLINAADASVILTSCPLR